MKKIISIFLVSLVIVSCSNDKKAQLQKLKKQQVEVAQQIKQLEDELRAMGDTTVKAVVKNKLVAITEIKPVDFEHFIEIQGKIDGDDNVSAMAEAPGTITRVIVKAGDIVKKGQVLIEMDASALYEQLSGLKKNLELATTVFEKQKSLWEQNIGSEVQYLQAKTTKESLEKQVAAMMEQIDMYRIKSPINGRAEDVLFKVGQTASPGYPVVRVVSFDKVKVVAEVPEVYSSKVKSGSQVKILIPDLNKEINASVTHASKFINPVNRTFTIESQLNPGVADFRANMIAVIKIIDYKAKDAFAIPVNSIQNDNGGEFVFVAKDINGQLVAKKQYIKVGIMYNGLTEIIEGVKEGDKIITTGYQDLEEDMPIKL